MRCFSAPYLRGFASCVTLLVVLLSQISGGGGGGSFSFIFGFVVVVVLLLLYITLTVFYVNKIKINIKIKSTFLVVGCWCIIRLVEYNQMYTLIKVWMFKRVAIK